jgi:hypothetical protein
MGAIVLRDDKHVTAVKGNDNDRWSSDVVMLWLERK